MADEYYIEGVTQAAAPQKSSDFLSFRIVFGDGAAKTEPTRPRWKRLTDKAFANHDEAGAWLESHATKLVREQIVAVRVLRVVSWHMLRPTVTAPLITRDEVLRLTAVPEAVLRDPVPIPGDEWKHPKPDDDDDSEVSDDD